MPGLIRRRGRKGLTYTVQINELPGRPRIGLGNAPLDDAREFQRGVKRLLTVARTGGELDDRTKIWLDSLSDDSKHRLAKLGLVGRFIPVPTIVEWLEAYLDRRSSLKSSSRQKYTDTIREMLRYFDPSIRIDQVTESDAEEWREWLYERGGDKPLAEATVRGHCRIAKAIFNKAKKAKLITECPFLGLVSASIPASRPKYVSEDLVIQILEACPSLDWRLLFGLARYAGLRVPSETHRLTWTDVNWDRLALNVQSIKTERSAGRDRRDVPIAPELERAP